MGCSTMTIIIAKASPKDSVEIHRVVADTAVIFGDRGLCVRYVGRSSRSLHCQSLKVCVNFVNLVQYSIVFSLVKNEFDSFPLPFLMLSIEQHWL